MHLEVLDKQRQEIFAKLKAFDGFYMAGGTALALQIGHRVSVDFDMFTDDKISDNLLPKIKRVFHEIKFLSVKEIAATKAYTIGRRKAYKDLVDLYFILKDKHANLKEIIEIAKEKYGSEFNDRLFLEQILYTDDIEEVELIFLKKKIILEDIKTFFKKEIKNIKF
mgnify:CR=1 FL=1